MLREPQETPFLGTFFHKTNQAATTYLTSRAPFFTYIFCLTLATALLGGACLTNDENEAWG